MEKNKKPDHKYFPENFEYDLDDSPSSTASASDYTGLIPAGPDSAEEREAYDEIYKTIPKIPPEATENKY